MSLIKSPKQIDDMRQAGKILAEILKQLHAKIHPGLDVWELEIEFLKLCQKYIVTPTCKNFTSDGYMPPFPTGLCVSINNQSVHCFPKKGVLLKNDDLITVDTVISYNGMHADSSFAKGVGTISESTKNLLQTSKQALETTVREVKPGVNIGQLAHTMYSYVHSQGFDVLRDYAGHGIGTSMHEDPEVPCFGQPNTGMKLIPGMAICIESLVCEGNPRVDEVSEWETKMHDEKRFLQFEYTVLVTDNAYEILTPLKV